MNEASNQKNRVSLCEFSYRSFKVITVTLSCWSVMFTYCRAVMETDLLERKRKPSFMAFCEHLIQIILFFNILRADSNMHRETDTIERTEVTLAVQGHKNKVQQDPQPSRIRNSVCDSYMTLYNTLLLSYDPKLGHRH